MIRIIVILALLLVPPVPPVRQSQQSQSGTASVLVISDRSVLVQWNDLPQSADGSDPSYHEFRVWRADGGCAQLTPPWVQQDSTVMTSWTDLFVEHGQAYCYGVETDDMAGEVSRMVTVETRVP